MRLRLRRRENDNDLIYIRRDDALALPAARRATRQLRMSGKDLLDRPVRAAAVRLENNAIPDRELPGFV